MRLLYTILLTLILGVQDLSSQNPWKALTDESTLLKSSIEREIIPEKYAVYDLDYDKVIKLLSKAPGEKDINRQARSVELVLPLPDGSFETFKVYESSCFSPVLAKKYPHIKSFRGISLDRRNQVRLDYGTEGFHAVIKSDQGTIYIDPYFMKADNNYISYYVKDHKVSMDVSSLTCGNHSHEFDLDSDQFINNNLSQKSLAEPVIKTTYRLALACTGTWGQIWGSVDAVMSRFNTGVNRINMIFENELAVRFELIANNDELIFLDPATDPYNNDNMAPSVLGQNTVVINNTVGIDAYDIGHVFTIFCQSGIAGIANPGSVCQGNRGAGVSCVGAANISNFMVNTTAHEIGHQFSCGHSWNICPNSQDQYSPGTAWEPGSGSTIMSYAGSCGGNNIAGTNDDYFHVGNVNQMMTFINTIPNCGTKEDSGNNTPDIVLDYVDGFTIPISTPFELDGIATDIDGDQLTHNWEQMNTGPTAPLGMPIQNGPSFRSVYPSSDTERIFPNLNSILNGNMSNREVLPTYSRDFRFRFTVRDNHPGAGSVVWEDVSFKATQAAGPFVLTYPDQLLFKGVGDTLSVKWDIAGTDLPPVNCENVNIYLSSNGGQDFDILLKENTPNDGSEVIIVPNEITNDARIKVAAADNIFFNIGRHDLIITQPSQSAFFVDVDNNNFEVCLPETIDVNINGTSFLGYDNPIQLEITSGIPPDAVVSFSNNPMAPDGNSVLIIDMSNVLYTGVYDLLIEAAGEDSDTVRQIITLDVVGTNFDDLAIQSPLSGSQGLAGTPIFEWTPAQNATNYTIEVSDNPSFESPIIQESGILGETFAAQIVLDNSTLYYWRVAANNSCVDEDFTPISTFGTAALSCKEYSSEDLPVNISATGQPSVRSVIEIFEDGNISDINVSNIRGIHQRVRDLKATLISPEGTSVKLFENRCFTSNFNVGFDSDSPVDFNCQFNSGIIMKPENEDLGILQGENIRGQWTLELDDTAAGEGGQFQNFTLELCSNISLDNPYLVNNNLLEVPVGLSSVIFQDDLLCDDNNNTAEELIYTLVIAPEKGLLFINGVEAQVGDRFTQADLNGELVRYSHEGTEEEQDQFVFTVIDGEGGWIDLTTFEINIKMMTSTEDLLEDDSRFSLYPNPVQDLLHIHDESETIRDWNVELISISGQLVLKDIVNKRTTVDLSLIPMGIYVVRLSNESGSLYYKISVTK